MKRCSEDHFPQNGEPMDQIFKDKKIYILTLGCKVNQYESDAIYEAFFAAGAVKGQENDADICIINTCSVTNIADRKSRQMISKLRKENPDALIVATGCYVQAVANRSEDSSIDADLIIGNNRKRDMVRLVEAHLLGQPVKDNIVDIAKDPEFEDLRIRMPETHTRSYLKIQDGCNSFCTYCIIPYVRGRIRNKPILSIIDEVNTLAASGVKEVVLTGINISSYGDIGEFSLADVVCRVAEIPGIERIRLGSLEPRILTEEFLDRIVKLPKVCPHFHLSLQSGCDTVLKRMNRHYTTGDIHTIVDRLRKYYDRPALTSDIIVGFPGETEEEFETTYRTLSDLSLYEMHVFPYSRRKGTNADKMDGHLPESVKKDRVRRLLELKECQMAAYESLFENETVNVLIEEIVKVNETHVYRGHTERYILVNIPCESLGDKEPKEERINKLISYNYNR